ncbi:MAG: hypothetical protein M0Z66_08805 [Thermaerobacter sp.]|nr:hypothetical protein [Thermaerobacter sp.]
MYHYMQHLLQTPQPMPLPAAYREFERGRPEEGIGESPVLWREAAKLESLRAMMPVRRIGHA